MSEVRGWLGGGVPRQNLSEGQVGSGPDVAWMSFSLP